MKHLNIDFNSVPAVKFEVTAEDLMKVVTDVIRETTNSILSKFENDRMPEFISRKEAMEKLDMKTANTMISWEEKGYLKPHRISGRIFYRKDELNEAYERVTRNYVCELNYGGNEND
jgi:hypothetical protein